MHYGFTITKSVTTKHGENQLDSSAANDLQWQAEPGAPVYHFSYQRNDHFTKDKLFFDHPEFIIGIDGVILNLQKLKTQYAIADWSDLFIHLYERFGEGMADQLYGNFSGFVLDKRSDTLLCFTDHCSAKKVYYHSSDDLLIISSSLQQVSKILSANNKNRPLNHRSAYAMLTAGGMFGAETLIEGVHRLHGGQYLFSSKRGVRINHYFDYNKIELTNESEAAVIDRLEEQFQDAVKLEYEKDKDYNKKHLATLSGGLDSRMNVGLAQKSGYTIDNLCFSQSGYADELIAKSIAQDLGQSVQFVPLDGGQYIFDFEENMDIYEGAVFYLSSAHFNYAIKKMDLHPYGLIHTGLLGDAILGTYISAPRTQAPEVVSKLQSTKLLSRVKTDLELLAKDYASEDIYNLHMRFFNVIISGSYAMEKYGYLTAPFMEPDFMRTCLSMPPKYKFQQKIYIKWLNQYHPELTNYTWEATGFKPRYTWQRSLSRFSSKAKHLWYGARGQSHKLNMTPYQHWYQTNAAIAPFLQKQFDQLIEQLDGAPILQADCKSLFNGGNVLEKSHVLTLLAGIERLNIET